MYLGYNVTLGMMSKKDWKTAKKYIPICWYGGLIDFFTEMNETSNILEITDDTPLLPRLRKNDSFLMKEFITAGVYNSELEIIN